MFGITIEQHGRTVRCLAEYWQKLFIELVILSRQFNPSKKLTLPTITLGKSKMSLLIVKQKVQGTTRLVGLISIHELYTAESVLSKACNAYFSQYSTAEGSLISYGDLIMWLAEDGLSSRF